MNYERGLINIASKKIKLLLISDFKGKLIKSILLAGSENDYRINSNDFANGAYLISAYDDENKIHVAKFMVIKNS